MKKANYTLIITVVVVGLIGLGWCLHSRSGRPFTFPALFGPRHVNSVANQPTLALPPPDPRVVSQNEWNQLRTTRDATLQANPDLAAEYQQLMAEMKSQQAKFDTAMIAADPKVAPILAKFLALRERTMAHSNSGPAAAH